MRIVNVLSIGAFFAILPSPILLRTEAITCTPQEYNCHEVCPGLWPGYPCYEVCDFRDDCSEPPSTPSSSHPSSSSSSSNLKSTQTLTPKTKIYKFEDLKEGDRVTTGKGERATIYVDARGSRVELEPNSAFMFVKPDNYQILKGKIAFFFKKLLREIDTPIRVRAGTATVTVRGTKFLTSVTKTKTIVQVLDGLVSVSNLKGTQSFDVSAGYQTTVTKTKLQTPKPFTKRQLIIPQ